uniref:hypothetical protein n=1 Tax=Stappia sp. TaxID=1870903 RepID=UPI003BACB948
MSQTRQIPGEHGDMIEIEVGETPFAELSRLMMVGISSDNNQLVWTAQIAPNGPWTGTLTPIDTGHAYIVLGTGSTLDGRVAMVAQTTGSPASVHYIDEAVEQAPGGGQRWNAPHDLGMPDGVAGFQQLVMGRGPSGRVEIFGVDADSGIVWWCYQNPLTTQKKTEWVTPPGTDTPIEVTVEVPAPPATLWSSWTGLSAGDVSRISLVNDASGRIMLIAMGQNPAQAQVHVNAQTELKSLTAGDWTGWERIDDATSGTAKSIPCGVLDDTGAINIFMVSSDNEVAQLRQTVPDEEGWSEWTKPGMTDTTLINVTSGFDGDGLIMLVAVAQDGGIWANLQTHVAGQRWNGWQKIATASGFGLAAMDYNSDGRLSYFLGASQNNSVSVISQTALNSTTWGAGWSQIASSGIFTYGIVRDLTPPDS